MGLTQLMWVGLGWTYMMGWIGLNFFLPTMVDWVGLGWTYMMGWVGLNFF